MSSGAAMPSRPSRVSFDVTMSRPEKLIPSSLEEAVAELKRDPSHPVHARVDGLDVEVRVLPSNETALGVGSRLAAIGPWEGIALEELDQNPARGIVRPGAAPRRPTCRDLAARHEHGHLRAIRGRSRSGAAGRGEPAR